MIEEKPQEEDWRMIFVEHLRGETLHRKPWTRPSLEWEHDHCAACNDRFMEEDLPDVLHDGYTTGEDYPKGAGYEWVCPTCFVELQPAIRWTAAEEPEKVPAEVPSEPKPFFKPSGPTLLRRPNSAAPP